MNEKTKEVRKINAFSLGRHETALIDGVNVDRGFENRSRALREMLREWEAMRKIVNKELIAS